LTKAEVLDALATVLSPYLGETMARASAQAHYERLGVRGDAISTAEIDAVVAKLASGLNVFVGRERAAGVLDEMRKAVEIRTVSPC
jgi:hypothetical protein